MAAFAAALILAVSLFATDRQPGQSVTGSFAQTPQQVIAESLAQAATDENQGQLDQAAQLYQSVLTKHPDNEVAMAQLGWLEYQSGRGGKNRLADRRRPVQAHPGRSPRSDRLRGPALPGDGPSAGGRRRSRRGGPVPGVPGRRSAPAIVKQAAPELRQAYQKAGVPVPSEVGG